MRTLMCMAAGGCILSACIAQPCEHARRAATGWILSACVACVGTHACMAAGVGSSVHVHALGLSVWTPGASTCSVGRLSGSAAPAVCRAPCSTSASAPRSLGSVFASPTCRFGRSSLGSMLAGQHPGVGTPHTCAARCSSCSQRGSLVLAACFAVRRLSTPPSLGSGVAQHGCRPLLASLASVVAQLSRRSAHRSARPSVRSTSSPSSVVSLGCCSADRWGKDLHGIRRLRPRQGLYPARPPM